jgi:hypothetical protein
LFTLSTVMSSRGEPGYRTSFLEAVPENARPLTLARAWLGDAAPSLDEGNPWPAPRRMRSGAYWSALEPRRRRWCRASGCHARISNVSVPRKRMGNCSTACASIAMRMLVNIP